MDAKPGPWKKESFITSIIGHAQDEAKGPLLDV